MLSKKYYLTFLISIPNISFTMLAGMIDRWTRRQMARIVTRSKNKPTRRGKNA